MESLYKNEKVATQPSTKTQSKPSAEDLKILNKIESFLELDFVKNKLGISIDKFKEIQNQFKGLYDKVEDIADKIQRVEKIFQEATNASSGELSGKNDPGSPIGEQTQTQPNTNNPTPNSSMPNSSSPNSPSSNQPGSSNTPPKEEQDEGKKYICKYIVKTFVIKLEDQKIEIDHSNILSIEYLNDYERHITSMLKVALRIDVRKKLWIIKNKEKISVKFELVKKGIDIESEKEVIGEEEVWNEEFTPYFSDEDDTHDFSSLEDRLDVNESGNTRVDETEEENYYETQNQFDLYLFQSKLLKASRFSFNRIYTENTLQNMVGEMLTESKHEKVLMSKFDNEEVYKEMLLPPLPIFKCLIYLDQYYGFYEKGAVIYYDVDAAYILNSDGKVTAKREEEWPETNFLVKELTASQPGQGMVRKEGEKVFYPTVSENEVNPQKLSNAQNVELGSKATIVTTDDIEVNKHEGSLKYDNTNTNEAITMIKKGTKYTGSIMQARMDEMECVVYINGENFDINAFTPNKTFKLTFDETTKQERFGKNEYRLCYSYHFLALESTELMKSSHRIILKKTNGPTKEE